MSCIVKVKVGNNTYLYESISYRGEDKKPHCKRKIIGKIDPANGRPIYRTEYIERMAIEGHPVPVSDDTTFTVKQIRDSTIRKVGSHHLFKALAERVGLREVLQSVFPGKWEEIFRVACFFVADGEALMHADGWSKTVDAPDADLSSQAISRLFMSMDQNDFLAFYRAWLKKRQENEFLALDITSISSYSRNIENVEWGYNRDGEKLPQINICLLLGINSRLPVLQADYRGSISDVRTFITTMRKSGCLGAERLTLVMDKGFWSKKNLGFLMNSPQKERFMMAVPFTVKEIRELVKANAADIDRPENTIEDDGTLRLLTRKILFMGKYRLCAHLIYNSQKAVARKNEVFAEAKRVLTLAKSDGASEEHAEEFKHWLTIRTSKSTGGKIVSIRQGAVEEEIAAAGWMVLLSNCVTKAEDALRIYRAKDAVEKGFLVYKNDFDLHRLRMHCGRTMDSKLFIGFISLILRSCVHNTMIEKKLYKKMTMKELIRELDKQKAQYISGNRILYPVSKSQKEIYGDFSIALPL